MPKIPLSTGSQKMTPWQRHKLSWIDCKRCGLCETRQRVVLARGKLPCDVLFIGEAPGQSEDTLGEPFIGPAGRKLDGIIAQALEMVGVDDSVLRIAFTNLVGCIPIGDDGRKTSEPEPESIKACSPRLDELVRLARPKIVVCVGELAEVWIMDDLDPKKGARGKRHLLEWYDGIRVSIVHPSAILRATPAHKGLMERRAVVRLGNAIRGYLVSRDLGILG